MEGEGLLTRTIYPEVPLRVEYALTDIGRAFRPVLDSIEQWGEQYIHFLENKNK